MKTRWLKRGSIEIQFNWVFVLIVGVIILAFFAKVTFQAQTTSNAKIGASVMKNLDTITVGASSSRDTVQLISIPDVELSITSDENCLRKYNIGRNSRQLVNTFIFSPEELEGTEIVSWTRDWNLPFRVTNLIYMTSPYVRYIVDTSNLIELAEDYSSTDVYIELPEELQKEQLSVTLNNLNNYKVRFLYFGTTTPNNIHLSNFKKMNDKDVTALRIIPEPVSDYEFVGTLEFYQKDDDMWGTPETSYYITEEAMFAAIFSDNHYIYDCNMMAAFERLRFVSQLYLNRTRLLYNDYEFDTCGLAYEKACLSPNAKIFQIREKTKEFSYEFPPATITPITSLYDTCYNDDDVNSLEDTDGLQTLNDYVLKNSCPEMY